MYLVRDHVGYMQLESVPGGTRLIWTQYFYPNSNFAMNFMARRVMMLSVTSRALKNLAKKVTA